MKNLYSSVFLVLFFGFSLVISGCKDEVIAPYVLPQLCDYFPDSMIYVVDKRILWIQTHVDGISSSCADLMFKQDCVNANQALEKSPLGIIKRNVNIQDGLKNIPFDKDKKDVLVIGFNHFWVVWLVRNGVDYQGIPVNYRVLDEQTFHDWLTRNLGAFPTPDQIQVITLQETQEMKNAPKGQPIQLQTLAQIQQQTQGQQPNIQQAQPNQNLPNIPPPLPTN